jgi:hypothetical protein
MATESTRTNDQFPIGRPIDLRCVHEGGVTDRIDRIARK